MMCVFAGLHAAKIMSSRNAACEKSADIWDNAGDIFFRTAASVMYVLAAIASHTGVKNETYYTLILIGLCLSLTEDILIIFNKSGTHMIAAGFLFYCASATAYISAMFSNSALSWREAAIFALLCALISAVIYNKKHGITMRKPFLIYGMLLCILAAKVIAMLFEQSGRYIYVIFAAAGTLLFIASQILQELKFTKRLYKKDPLITILYYSGQGLIALSVTI